MKGVHAETRRARLSLYQDIMHSTSYQAETGKHMKIYMIAWGGQDDPVTYISFASERDRDATWDAIQAIPWEEGTERQKKMFKGYFSRDVEVAGVLMHEVRDQPMLGTIYKTEVEVLDAPATVKDITRRNKRT